MNRKNWIKEKFGKRRFFSGAYISIFIVAIITIGATYLFHNNSVNKGEIRFENEVTKINARLENELTKRIVALKSSKQMMETDDALAPIKKVAFTKTEDLGFMEYKSRVENTFSQPAEIDFNNLSITEFYQSDFILESLDKEALINAVKNNNLAVSTIRFKENEDQFDQGFLMLLPIFNDGTTDLASLRGFVFTSFAKESLLADVYKTSSPKDIYFTLSVNEQDLWTQDEISLGNSIEKNDEIFGVSLKANYYAYPTFYNNNDINLTALIPIGGTLIGILIFTFLRYQARMNLELTQIAEELEEAREEKAGLLVSEQKARKDAEKSSRLKDDFISMVSHEIRTPLNSIAGWTSILRSKDVDNQTKQKALDTISKNIKTQSAIIDELLLVSNLTAGEKKLKTDLTKISAIIEQVFEEVDPKADQKQIRLIKENNLNGEKIYCDKNKINKALKNLLQNAIKFTPRGGEVKFLANKSEDAIELNIKDTGRGIEKEFLPHIFDKFSQADSSTTREFGGLGLGLAITKQIIELHGGEIKVLSNGKGKGAEFEVKLPKHT